jgi:phosphatidylserine/phosphatidylglycerophosphate/cardiolipin synthase-like enzyme
VSTKNTLAALIAGLLFGAAAGYGFSAEQSGSLRSRATELEQQNTGLKAQVSILQTQLAETNKGQTAGDFVFLGDSFSRTGDTSAVLRRWMGRANSTIRVAIYSFTSDTLGDALVAAKARGIDVQVYYEGDNLDGSGSEYQKLVAAGVSVRADVRSALMHHKFMVVDDRIVATGSYNWSASAEDSNDENLVVIRSGFLAKDYLAEFSRLWGSGTG